MQDLIPPIPADAYPAWLTTIVGREPVNIIWTTTHLTTLGVGACLGALGVLAILVTGLVISHLRK